MPHTNILEKEGERQVIYVTRQQSSLLSDNSPYRERLHIYPEERIAFHECPQGQIYDQVANRADLQRLVPSRSSVYEFVEAADTLLRAGFITPSGQLLDITTWSEFQDEAKTQTKPLDRFKVKFNATEVQYLDSILTIDGEQHISVLETFAKTIKL